MKMLMLVARSSMEDELVDILVQNGVATYTLLNKIEGKGATGTVLGSFFYPGYNLLIMSVLPPDLADRVVNALKAFHANRARAAHENPIPLKMFSWPCEEIV